MSKSDKGINPLHRDAKKLQDEEPNRRKSPPKRQEPERLHKWRKNYGNKWLHHLPGPNRTRCYMKPVLNVKYDAMYCPRCKIWLEERCDPTKNCETCKGRPSIKRLKQDGLL